MLCPDCNINKDQKDFINSQTSCYQCIYRKKILQGKITQKNRTCKICAGFIEDVKKFSYCCEECAYIGKYKVRKARWAS